MQRYWWPGYEIHLLEELQRQQNNAQFCDTLLQTEGISVPTHSCILAALSPYLSQRLTVARSPPLGQKRQLQLQAVKAQTLLKIVGLLYSGELEVKGGTEQDDVLSAARQFGITDLVEGRKDLGMNEGEIWKRRFGSCREKEEQARKLQDAQVQAEIVGRRATDCPPEKRSCVSTGTQTVTAGEQAAGRSFTCSTQTKPPASEPASSVAKGFFIRLQPPNIRLDNDIYSTDSPLTASMHGEAPSGGESTLDQSSDSTTDPTSTSAWPNDVTSFPISLNDVDEGSNSPPPQEETSNQQSFESGDRTVMGIEDEQTNTEPGDKRENAEQQGRATRDEVLGQEKGGSAVKKHAHAKVGMKSLAKMKKMMGTQISIKVKLRRRTKGEVWEVVSMQDADETLSVLTSLKKTDLTKSGPSSLQQGPIYKPEAPIIQPATMNSAEPPLHLSTPSDIQLPSSDCFTPNHNDDLESVPLSQPPSPVEDSDEQIEKLLEDIMMGLNILPSLEHDYKKSNHLHLIQDRTPAVSQAPVTEKERAQSQMHAGINGTGCVYYPEFGHSSSDTGQSHPSCSSLSSPTSVSVVVQQQQQYPPYHSSVIGQRDETSHQDASKSQSYSCTEMFSQDNQNMLKFEPLTNGNEGLSFSLPCMDELWLPQCLSPLQPFASAAKHQPVYSNTTNNGDNFQPPLHGRPWLAENPGALQFPLSAITQSANKSASVPRETKDWSNRWQENLVLNPQTRGARAESSSVKVVDKGGTIPASHQKMIPHQIKEGFSCKQGVTNAASDAAGPKKRKRKCTSHPQDVAGTLLAYKDVKISDGTNSLIRLNVCSVSLSSNNVLAKQSKMASSYKVLEKSEDHSADLTLITTRGCLKKSQKKRGNTSRDKIVTEQGAALTKRKRGRQRKTKLEQGPMVINETNGYSEQHEQRMSNDLPKEESETKTLRMKRKRNKCEVEVVSLTKNSSAESNNKAEADNSEDVIAAEREVITTKKLPMVTLKQFTNLIKRQHTRTRLSQKSQATSETAGDAESAEKTRDSRCEELIKETEMDAGVAWPQSSEKHDTEESCVTFSVMVDKNNNHTFNRSTAEKTKVQRDDTNASAAEETVKHHPVCYPDVLGEEGAESAAEWERWRMENGAQNSCDTTLKTTLNDEGSSHSEAHTPPQKNKMLSDHNLNPLTLERTGPPLADTVGLIKSSGCIQKDDVEEEEVEEEEDVDVEVVEVEEVEVEEAEEEVEVDVLLYSPDKVPQSRGYENELDNMDVTPEEEEEEEEEEDVNVIDLTGDETE